MEGRRSWEEQSGGERRKEERWKEQGEGLVRRKECRGREVRSEEGVKESRE